MLAAYTNNGLASTLHYYGLKDYNTKLFWFIKIRIKFFDISFEPKYFYQKIAHKNL